MQVTGVPFDEFAAIVAKVSHENYGDNLILHPDSTDQNGVRSPRIRVRMRTKVGGKGKFDLEPGSRRSWSGRRMPVACWHTYRDVLAEMFERYPNARAKTAMSDYRGKEGFEANYPATADQNIGSMVQPAYMPDLCDCEND